MKKLAIIFGCFLFGINAQGQTISTFVSSTLYNPDGVAADSHGNLYVADEDGHKVFKVTPSGTVTTFAGDGSSGSGGDGGAATAAELLQPMSVAVDATGNVFIADQGSRSVRKVNTSGVISTVAGSGSSGYSGDGGAATAAELAAPYGVAVDGAGNLYIADANSYVVRKVNTSGIISTFAGNGSYGYTGDGGPATAASLSYPYGVAADASGNVYITDYNNYVVRKVNPSGVISTFAGNGSYTDAGDGGAATDASLELPWGICTDASGNVYVVDYNSHRVRKINSSGIISTVVGTGTGDYTGDGGPATAATLYYPKGVAVDASGNMFISDNANYVVRKVSATTVNHAPVFIYNRAPYNNTSLCQDFGPYPITEVLQARDADAGQTLTWSVAAAPSHGTATVSYSTVMAGTILRPVGVSYTPATGYVGRDTMMVTISDGITSTTSIFTFMVYAKPSAPVISGATTMCAAATTTLTASPAGGYWGSMDGNTSTNITTGVVTARGSGTSTIYYNGPYDSHGCRTQSRTTITILDIPSAGTISGVSNMCPGSSSTLSESVSGGTWSSNNTAIATVTAGGSVTGVSSGSATISYTVSNSCFSRTATRSVTVAGPTALSPIDGSPNLRPGSSVTFTNPRSGGTWSSSNSSVATVSTVGVVSAVAPGTGSIIYSYTNTCGITSSVFKSITVLSRRDGNGEGPAEVVNSASLKVYPNPTTGSVVLDLAGGTGKTEVVLYDLAGRLINATNSENTRVTFDMSNLAKGIYLVKVTNNGVVYQERIIVE